MDSNQLSSNLITNENWIDIVEMGNLNLIKYFINNGIDINYQDKSNGNTALIISINNNTNEITKELLKHPDIDVNIPDNCGNTALIWSCYYEHKENIKELLKSPNIDVNIADKDNVTALYLIKKRMNGVIEKLLIEHGATKW